MKQKKSVFTLSLALLLSSSLYAVDVTKEKDSKTKTFNEVDDKYKAEKGKMWYEDIIPGEKKEQDKAQQPKAQPQPKDINEAILQTLQKIATMQEQQLVMQQKMILILQEEFDPKPHNIINAKGEQCVANSSVDCFEMPIVAEAKRVPVLAAWIKEPTIENATEYLKWQAKFFDYKFKNGYSLNLASKQYGDKAYPAAATPEEFGSINGDSIRQKNELIASIIASKSKNMSVFIFMGKTSGFEIEYPHKLFEIYAELRKLGISTKIVFKDNETLAFYKTVLETSSNKTLAPRWKEITDTGNVLVSAATFNKVDPHATPYTLLQYKDKNIDVTQAVSVGKDTWYETFQGIHRTLILNNIILPAELHGNKTSDVIAKEVINGINKTAQEQKALETIKKPAKKEVK